MRSSIAVSLVASLAACSFEPVGGAIDECALALDDCDPAATCTDAADGFTCACDPGFAGDGKTCAPALYLIGAGTDATCGLDGAGRAWCWGANDRGQLGDGSGRHHATPTAVAGAAGWRALAVGPGRACALDADGAAWCWGAGGFGFGDGTTDDAAVPRLATGARRWSAVTVGGGHQCALDAADGSAWCWGDNRAGQLGDGTTTTARAPVRVNGGPWTAITAGGRHTCALGAVGLACWGAGGDGQLGAGGESGSPIPQLVTGAQPSSPWRLISAGAAHTCGVRDDGLWCWGQGGRGALGDGAREDRRTPVRISTAAWSWIGAGAGHTCGISDGALACWGDDDLGQRGDGGAVSEPAATPVRIGARTDWRGAGTLGDGHGCATTADGAAWCWGHDGFDQLGRGPRELTMFTRFDGLAAIAVAMSATALCAVDAAGGGGCAGRGASGLRGDGSYLTREEPSRLTGPWLEIAPGANHACGLDRAHGLSCWGSDADGALGNGAGGSSPTPTAVTGSWARVAVGGATTCAISDDHDLACWGGNATGQVGDGGFTRRDAPVFVLYASLPWRELAVGGAHTCAIDGAGDLYCWGDNGAGQLGVGGASGPRPTPLRVGTATDWLRVAVGVDATCGIRGVGGSGTLWCWGDNAGLQLGLGAAVVTATSPTQVGAVDTWTAVAVGRRQACAVRVDGSLWCWGASEWSAHGQPDAVDTPRPIGAELDWRAVVAADDATCAIKADASVWCAGANRWSHLGRAAVETAPTSVALP